MFGEQLVGAAVFLYYCRHEEWCSGVVVVQLYYCPFS